MTGVDTLCQWIALSSAALSVYSYETATAYDHPVHTFTAALGVAAFALVSVARAVPSLFTTSTATHVTSSLPLDDGAKASALSSPPSDDTKPIYLRVNARVLAAAVVIITLRLEVYRLVSKTSECALDSVEVWLPLLLFVYDSVRTQRHQSVELPSGSAAGLVSRLKVLAARCIVRPRFRYIPSIAAVCLGCRLLLATWRPLNSTYVCPITSQDRSLIPLLQTFGLLLDFALTLLVYETIPRGDVSGRQSRRIVFLWSTALFVPAVIWAIAGLVLYTFKPELRLWLLLLDAPSFFLNTVFSIVVQAILLTVLLISTLHTIVISGVFNTALTLTVLGTLLPLVSFLWTFRHDVFPPIWPSSLAFALSLIYLGWWSFHQVRHTTDSREPGPRRPRIKLLLLVGLLVAACLKPSSLPAHPIDKLLSDASRAHQEYLNSASLDSELPQVVARYKDRYGRAPPPGFDAWWKFSTDRWTLVLDEFNQIEEDLLPFWAVPPAEIRKQTWEMISNPWNEIGGVFIRDGVASAQENVPPTHAWMLKGVARMINDFSLHLPDMDLAFNLNDESRVVLPFHELQSLRQQGEATKSQAGTSSWSPNRASGWTPIPDTPVNGTSVFHDMAFQSTFDRFGSVGCPPGSASLTRRRIASQSTLCYSCAAPHSTGHFVSNWSLASDVCHQPDLADLHGFYLSPAAFKTTYSLRPVFSQSKPHPYNDILYPSAWNFFDKVVYDPSEPDFPDPPFAQKDNTLFWRGSTSEGASIGDGNHAWRGMVRQRLIHLANNLTSHPHDDVTLFLPTTIDDDVYDDEFTYTTTSAHGPQGPQNLGLSIDARVVDHISRCAWDDCDAQEVEFAPASVPISNFQAHWRHKYLFDLDGAGFSGRFLPLLQSKSVPFKATIFREWYHSRLTPWKHFVPVDVRLHGVWSTLAYFTGINPTDSSANSIAWRGHQKAAEEIATEGRDWSNTVVRKADMEVYLFRLLLEWGRITDDNRENLGYKP